MNKKYVTATNALVVVNIMTFMLVNAVFGGKNSGLELYFLQNPNYEPWQFVSYMFLHGSWTHLGFNMLGLWMFGQVLERFWGYKKFLIFYAATGVGAAILYMAINHLQFQSAIEPALQSAIPMENLLAVFAQGQYYSEFPETGEAAQIFLAPMVGASGAIYGILVAFAWLFPNFKMALIFLPVPVAAKYFVPALLLLDLFSGVTGFSIFGGNNVAHFAHIGGAIIGAIIMVLWGRESPYMRRK